MKTGKIVKIFNNINNIQVMCADDRGLLSVYFDRDHFLSFHKAIRKTGLKLNGLLINFDRHTVNVPALGGRKEYCSR